MEGLSATARPLAAHLPQQLVDQLIEQDLADHQELPADA